MITQDIFETCVLRAGLAPSVHNTQPARWQWDGARLTLMCDTDVGLTVYDPDGRHAALSCGAVLEAMVLALSAHGFGAHITLTTETCEPGQGLVPVAYVQIEQGQEDGLHSQLEHRFTWRGAFAPDPPDLFGWTRSDTRFVMDQPGRAWLAARNDEASFDALQSGAFRRELVSWMRLRPGHQRAGLDGMDAAALGLSAKQARSVALTMGPLWRVLTTLGQTKRHISEYDVTLTAPIIALFHMDLQASQVEAGRAYLRLGLEAASLGLASWPMAALSDTAALRGAVCEKFGIGPDRRLIQVLRFGVPTGPAPARARRPLKEILR